MIYRVQLSSNPLPMKQSVVLLVNHCRVCSLARNHSVSLPPTPPLSSLVEYLLPVRRCPYSWSVSYCNYEISNQSWCPKTLSHQAVILVLYQCHKNKYTIVISSPHVVTN